VLDFYREGFIRALDRELVRKASFKLVIDFNHSTASQVLPGILNDLGCEVIALNAYIDEVQATKRPEDREKSLEQLSRIVTSLGANGGFWLDPTVEGILVVDESGRVYGGEKLLVLMTALLFRSGAQGAVAVPVAAPSVIESMAEERRCTVRRTKGTERAMMEAAQSSEVLMAATMDGRFAFPRFQAAFDGMFAIARTVELLAAAALPLSRLLDDVPSRAFLQTRVSCVWEMKGGIMRKMSEDSVDKEANFTDGIKVSFGSDWVLVLPDQYLPFVHIVAEARDEKGAARLLEQYRQKVEEWKKEL
jgi:mannose-1-phosphate guanylyltransferase/phosphomannomutase